ncbi:LysR family transcriptional regulator [Cystobacter fuscus]|uniref:LysR family transcriptional regulator n=1 Tax=Cystobacter fuscus TaxID=43 RepID=UPI0006881981|nr:LysR family transcriptional regulator [Cystobacter fuscus]
MDDLNVIRIFLAAADAGSFAQAALKLRVTRSAVAKAIARLEAQTGTRLFHRTTRVVSLTDEGRALQVRCARTIADLEGAIDDLPSRRDEPQGILRMTLVVSEATTVPSAFSREEDGLGCKPIELCIRTLGLVVVEGIMHSRQRPPVAEKCVT